MRLSYFWPVHSTVNVAADGDYGDEQDEEDCRNYPCGYRHIVSICFDFQSNHYIRHAQKKKETNVHFHFEFYYNNQFSIKEY